MTKEKENIVGKRFKSNSCNEFTVLEKSDKKHGKIALYEIVFDEVNRKSYKTLAEKSAILKGNVKNRYYPTVYGIGYLGESSHAENKYIYTRWRAILNRCYNSKDKSYKYYGGRGVQVCERWHCFANFLEDLVKMEGYDKANIHNLEVDKDSLFPNNLIYSLQTCILISQNKNVKEMNERTKQKWFEAFSPDGRVYISNNQTQFGNNNDLVGASISQVLSKKSKQHKGWKFERFDMFSLITAEEQEQMLNE